MQTTQIRIEIPEPTLVTEQNVTWTSVSSTLQVTATVCRKPAARISGMTRARFPPSQSLGDGYVEFSPGSFFYSHYTQTFGYDQLNRLTTSQEGASWSQTNSYDRYGNRTIVGSGMTFNANNNRITNAGYTYDLVGNLLTDGAHSYTYDAENKISKVDAVSAYVYDGEGQRVRKLVGENLRFIYDMGGKQIAEFNGATGALTKEYIYGASGLVATIEPTTVNANGTRYTTSDHLGSPRVVTSSGAAVVSRHDYKPFGEELGSGIGGRTVGMGYVVADGLRQKFTSKERDNETGLDYFEARYYSSAHGRFTSADSVLGSALNPQTLNLYAYVHNNPLAFTDPTGHIAQSNDEALRWQIFEEMSGGNRRVEPTATAPVPDENRNSGNTSSTTTQQRPQDPVTVIGPAGEPPRTGEIVSQMPTVSAEQVGESIDERCVGNSCDCVPLVKEITDTTEVHTSRWREGEAALGNDSLAYGTPIATFVNGRYPS